MSIRYVYPAGHQINIVSGYDVYECKDCHGFFFISKKEKVEKAAPNHTWNNNDPSKLRHLTKEERNQRVNTSFYPMFSTLQKIINVLTVRSYLNFTEIREKTLLSSRTLNKALKKLEAKNIVKCQWQGKNKIHSLVNHAEAQKFLADEENSLYMRKYRFQSTLF
jgi:DNA-binding transcriptional ArsR family regulator